MSRKRQRANTNGDNAFVSATTDAPVKPHEPVPQWSIPECVDWLDGLDDGAYTRSLLLKLASENPVIADTIRRVYHNKAYAEQNKVISFNSYPSRIWHSINKDYRSMRGSAQYEKAWDVFRDV